MATNRRTPNRPTKLERATFYELLAAQGYRRCNTPVNITVHCVRRRRIDVGNTCEKAAIDGLVCAGVLPADGPKQIETIAFSQEQGQVEKTIITFTET